MKNPRVTLRLAFVVAGTIGAWGIQGLDAQPQPSAAPFTRTLLQTRDLSIPGRAVVVAHVDYQPGAEISKHTHPGEETGYVLEGTLTLAIEGNPPVTLKAGDAYFIEAGRAHAARNGNTPAKVLETYILEKGRPLAQPAK